MNFNFDSEEEECSDDNHYNFNRGYTDGSFSISQIDHLRPTISYLYIDTEKTDYNFSSSDFGNKEQRIYFEKMKKYAQTSLQDLINKSRHEEHFKISPTPSSREKELLEQLIGTKIKKENAPIVGHFALYTEKQTENKSKAPRIYFLLGEHSVIHILFFDPFHEIHPTPSNTK